MYLPELKFSLWADFIEREFIDTGLRALIDEGIVNGATSNPAIFKNAILTSRAYQMELESLRNMTAKEKYEALAIHDIRSAADVLRPLFDQNDSGYVSLEVDPFLCDDAQATIDEGKRLFDTIDRPNVMIKVPATDAGFVAMEALVAQGIPVNATLIFSQKQALSCVEAFKKGLEASTSNVDTVISVFVSRFDRKLDGKLREADVEPALVGIYNAAAIYSAIESSAVQGCRTLFASTGVKGDDLRPSYYIDELLAFNSVNTAPIATIEAFVEQGDQQPRLPLANETISAHLERVEKAGIDMNNIENQLMAEGLTAFKEAFSAILKELE